MENRKGKGLILLIIGLVFVGGIYSIIRVTGNMGSGIRDESGVYSSLTEVIVKGNGLVQGVEGGMMLNDPKFDESLKKISEYQSFLASNRKSLEKSGSLGRKYLKPLDTVNASLSAVLARMDYLSTLKNDYLEIKGGSLYELTFKEAMADKDNFYKKSSAIKSAVERLEKTKVDLGLTTISEKWTELLTVRRNFMAALEESLKYNVPYQWALAQSRYPDKEKQVLLDFEKEVGSVSIDLEWLRSVRFLNGN